MNILILSFGIAVLILGIFGGIGAFLVLGKIDVQRDDDASETPIRVKNLDAGVPPGDETNVRTVSTDELMKMVSKEENGN